MLELVASPEQRKFGQDKRDTLTSQCRNCKVLNWCNGGCPKDRFALSRDGEPGQNYLCAGLELFFTHTGPTFTRDGAAAATGPRAGRRDGVRWRPRTPRPGAYRPCPCGSGRKFRFCHGDKAPASPFSQVDGAAPASGTATPR